MSAITTDLAGIDRSYADASQGVGSRRDRFQMRGIHAHAITAKVIHFQAVRDRTDPSLVGESVNRKSSVLVIDYESVSVAVLAACPLKTAGSRNAVVVPLIDELDFC
jgi:hypothetical protein